MQSCEANICMWSNFDGKKNSILRDDNKKDYYPKKWAPSDLIWASNVMLPFD